MNSPIDRLTARSQFPSLGTSFDRKDYWATHLLPHVPAVHSANPGPIVQYVEDTVERFPTHREHIARLLVASAEKSVLDFYAVVQKLHAFAESRRSADFPFGRHDALLQERVDDLYSALKGDTTKH